MSYTYKIETEREKNIFPEEVLEKISNNENPLLIVAIYKLKKNENYYSFICFSTLVNEYFIYNITKSFTKIPENIRSYFQQEIFIEKSDETERSIFVRHPNIFTEFVFNKKTKSLKNFSARLVISLNGIDFNVNILPTSLRKNLNLLEKYTDWILYTEFFNTFKKYKTPSKILLPKEVYIIKIDGKNSISYIFSDGEILDKKKYPLSEFELKTDNCTLLAFHHSQNKIFKINPAVLTDPSTKIESIDSKFITVRYKKKSIITFDISIELNTNILKNLDEGTKLRLQLNGLELDE